MQVTVEFWMLNELDEEKESEFVILLKSKVWEAINEFPADLAAGFSTRIENGYWDRQWLEEGE